MQKSTNGIRSTYHSVNWMSISSHHSVSNYSANNQSHFNRDDISVDTNNQSYLDRNYNADVANNQSDIDRADIRDVANNQSVIDRDDITNVANSQSDIDRDDITDVANNQSYLDRDDITDVANNQSDINRDDKYTEYIIYNRDGFDNGSTIRRVYYYGGDDRDFYFNRTVQSSRVGIFFTKEKWIFYSCERKRNFQ